MIRKNAVKVTVGSEDLASNDNITQTIIIGDDFKEKRKKFRDLMKNMVISKNSKVLIFMHTKKDCDKFESELTADGYPCKSIHGDKIQIERDATLRQFKNGDLNILIATDVASRGLDIKTLTNVINYDFP